MGLDKGTDRVADGAVSPPTPLGFCLPERKGDLEGLGSVRLKSQG